MIMSAMVKSPEHQQGPTALAPSNSERRKAAATPEGECGVGAYMRDAFCLKTNTYMLVLRLLSDSTLALTCTHIDTHVQCHSPRIIYENAYYPFSFKHLSERRRVTFESKLSKLMVSSVWSLISLLLLPHPHPRKAGF